MNNEKQAPRASAGFLFGDGDKICGMEISIPKAKEPSRLHFGVIRIILGVFAAGGCFLLSIGVWASYQDFSAQGWTKVSGIVLSSQVETLDFDGKHEPHIRYSYTWDSQSWVGERIQICYWMPSRDSEDTSRLVDEYPAGKKIDVFVNPNNPSKSVLKPGIGWPHARLLCLGLLATGLSALGMWTFSRSPRPKHHSSATTL